MKYYFKKNLQKIHSRKVVNEEVQRIRKTFQSFRLVEEALYHDRLLTTFSCTLEDLAADFVMVADPKTLADRTVYTTISYILINPGRGKILPPELHEAFKKHYD